MIKWTDATSYSKGRRDVDPQTGWQTIISGVNVFVSKGHRGYSEQWILTCGTVGIGVKPIGNTENYTTDEALRLAVMIVTRTALRKAERFNNIAKEFTDMIA